jgi:hypothetical protein
MAKQMIARTKTLDPMEPYVEVPDMLPRVSLNGDTIRMPYVNAQGRQVCLIIGDEESLNYLERSIIEVRAKLNQRRIDELNRQIQIP